MDMESGGNMLVPKTKYTIGTVKTKNTSSKNIAVSTTAVLLPPLRPSLYRKNIAGPVPPTTEGEIAELNSHSIITLNACFHVNLPSVKTIIRYIYAKSLTAIITKAIKM